MGKKIDGFVCTAAIAAGFYLYYHRSIESRVAALILAILSCIVAEKIYRRAAGMMQRTSWLQKRRIRKSADGALMHLACIAEEEALEKLSRLLNKSYGADFPIHLIQAHPSMTLSQQSVFDAWRTHRGEERLVICATCRSDPGCSLLASSLRAPRVALADAALLGQLIAEHPEGMLPPEQARCRPKLRLRRAAMLIFNRRNAPRCLLFSASMLLMYLLSANIYYLASALLLLFIALASLRQANRPAKLF